MSLFVLCVAAVVVGSDALAGPLEESVLRGSTYYGDGSVVRPRVVPGSPLRYRWEGLYLGGHAGYSNVGVDFGNGTASLIDYILRNDVVGTHVADWTTLSKVDSNRAIFGGFVGYNFQADELVFGGELNYNFIAPKATPVSASDSMTRLFNDDAQAPAQHHYFYTTTIIANASARLTDFGTVRARAGVVLDKFLPYAFAGAAIGRVDVNRSATVSYVRRDIPDNVPFPDPPIVPQAPFTFGPQTSGEQREGVIAYGYTAGLGMDVALLPNVFARAEWEYIQFIPVQDFKIRINTFRAGVGVKF